MNNKEEKFKLAKRAQFDLLCELKRICKKNDIKYFLIGGTLLGAVRHNGFIPWDDDIDVGMVRKEYDRFKKVCKEELNYDYFLSDWNIDSSSPLPFSKLKIKGTHYKENIALNAKTSDEIFIDIFPFDNVPNNKLKRKSQAIKSAIIRKILLLKCNFLVDNKKIKKKIGYAVLNIISKIHSTNEWKNIYTKLIKKYNKFDTKYLVNMGGSYSYKREMISLENTQKLIEYQFEKEKFLIPYDYDNYLKNVYGDYMKLPPKEKRTSRHEVRFIDLGKYSIRN